MAVILNETLLRRLSMPFILRQGFGEQVRLGKLWRTSPPSSKIPRLPWGIPLRLVLFLL